MSQSPRTCSVSAILVEHNPLAVKTIESILRGMSDIRMSGCYPSKGTNWESIGKNLICIVDRGSYTESANSHLQQIRSRFPNTRLVVVDHLVTPKELGVLFALGVSAFVPYHAIDRDLPKAIRSVILGRPFMPRKLQEGNIQRLTTATDELTPRQQEIVALVQAHMTDKEIGTNLGISVSTVKFHLQKVFSKVSIHNRKTLGDALNVGAPPRRPASVISRLSLTDSAQQSIR